MNRNEWGIKRICLGCGVKFYDFNKSPIVCPSCGAVFDPESLMKRKGKGFVNKVEDNIFQDLDNDILDTDDGIEDLTEDDEEMSLDNDKD